MVVVVVGDVRWSRREVRRGGKALAFAIQGVVVHVVVFWIELYELDI
jgi:hypothetical protein